MSILPIVIAPNPILKKPSEPVEKIDGEIQKLMDQMLQTMYSEKGLGLAAVQVGVLKRILVMDVEYEMDEHDHHHHDHSGCGGFHIKNGKPIFMVNPKIIQSSKTVSFFNEGCLSFPESRAEVERPAEVSVEYLDYNGAKQILEADGILATCVQHEIDHLNGVTFVDHISKIKREMILKKVQKKYSNN